MIWFAIYDKATGDIESVSRHQGVFDAKCTANCASPGVMHVVHGVHHKHNKFPLDAVELPNLCPCLGLKPWQPEKHPPVAGHFGVNPADGSFAVRNPS